VPGTPIVHAVLGVFDRWRPLEAAAAAVPDAPPNALERLVDRLVELTLLQRSDRPVAGLEAEARDWRPWGPAASFFHFATRDVPFASDLAEVHRRMRAKARREPLPLAIKRHRGAPQVALPPMRATGDFPAVVRGRRTWRQFGARAASVADLADVLGLTFGVQRWVGLPGIGRVALKSSPSGGALHPIECYVLALRVDGLARGLYHYRGDTHVLERLPRRAGVADVPRFLPGQPWYAGASAVVLMTAVFARTRWRYPNGRAYRVILAEAGHLCQTFCLAATWRGLAPFCTMALADTIIERKIGVDGVSEAVIYAAGFGTRPAGVDWAPWPANRARRARATCSRGRSASAPSQNRRNWS
jgi:SagB-type dehydrogenase family enzyme